MSHCMLKLIQQFSCVSMHVKIDSFVFFCAHSKACVKEYKLNVSAIHVSPSINRIRNIKQQLSRVLLYVKTDTTTISLINIC